MVSWVELNFAFVIYSNYSQLTYSLIGPLAMATRVLWIRSVLLSRIFLLIGSLVFPGTQHCVGDAYSVIKDLDFLKKNISAPKNGENRSSLGFFECIWKFSYYLFQVYNNCCMLAKILENFASWHMCQNVIWPIRLKGF